ncbi:MAG: GNAT family N-acetyltransferase [Nanoarchaeota archaeon]|nr:GNAT family N-acetyltransferase [Nanoarchaeota archaeon]
MRIRKAGHTDIITCANIKMASEGTVHSEKDKILNQKYLKKYLDDEYSTILVAEDKKEAIGYVVFSYDEWNNSVYINFIFVRPDKQKHGVGTKLLDAVVSRAEKRGARIIFLKTGKTKNNAIRFYKKNSFLVAGYIKDMYRGVPGNALVLSRKL